MKIDASMKMSDIGLMFYHLNKPRLHPNTLGYYYTYLLRLFKDIGDITIHNLCKTWKRNETLKSIATERSHIRCAWNCFVSFINEISSFKLPIYVFRGNSRHGKRILILP